VVNGERIVDLNLAYTALLAEEGLTGKPYEVAYTLLPSDMLEYLKSGQMAKEAANKAIDFVNNRLNHNLPVNGPRGEKVIYQMADVKLLAPVPRPNSIRDTMSFEGHMKALGRRTNKPIPDLWYQMPVYYKGNPCTVIGPEEPIRWPSYTKLLDYELEFGIYIGKQGKNIQAEEAEDYIAGYTIFNDVSARDILVKELSLFLGPAKGKDFDFGNVMGPCLVTPDELDVRNLKLRARINGEVWSEGNTSDMYWTFPKIIEYISASETLYPGDFIGSGTVAFGCGDEQGRYLKPGDIVELEVEGIGILRNQIIQS
jgi:2-keto-4-pentenoate hydratase/2-oxohepta-3-ene-1,7-dioic acid hydratase in catechol pathway